MSAPAYPISAFWSDEDGAWVADAPDLSFCSALGAAPHEAVAEVEVEVEVEEAVVAWLDAATGSGRPLPAPSVPARRA